MPTKRLLEICPSVYTTSDPNSGTPPLPPSGNLTLPRILVEDMKAMGIEDAFVDEHCYVYGTIPATPGCEKQARAGPHRPHGHRARRFRARTSTPSCMRTTTATTALARCRYAKSAKVPHLPFLKRELMGETSSPPAWQSSPAAGRRICQGGRLPDPDRRR